MLEGACHLLISHSVNILSASYIPVTFLGTELPRYSIEHSNQKYLLRGTDMLTVFYWGPSFSKEIEPNSLLKLPLYSFPIYSPPTENPTLKEATVSSGCMLCPPGMPVQEKH